jgi:dedicator of cytokinesis protein 3
MTAAIAAAAAAAAAATGTPDPRSTRSDKARLSLTFLKRGNVTENRGNVASKVNGNLLHIDEDTASNTSASASASRSRSKNRLSFLQNNNSNSEELQRNNSLASNDRPPTSTTKSEVSKSERSGSSSLVDRVGSVKKRLSVLGIGKSSSKSSKTKLGGELVPEE